jgi:phosphopantothenoylcysteine synthetase/decarboxylase
MGFAIAQQLANKGAMVRLVSGPVSLTINHPNIIRTNVITASEMYDACLKIFPGVDGAVMCAAVADFTPLMPETQKVKRGKENYTIELTPTRDIAASLGSMKQNNQLLVGFALETNNERENAVLKLKKKNLDFIVLNSLNDPGAGFQTDTNKITIIGLDNKSHEFELKTKDLVALDIVDFIIEMTAR